MLDILSKEGFIINPGTSTKMIYNYDKSLIDIRESRIKEWDFYQFIKDEWILQLTIGHASLFDSFGFNLINTKRNNKFEHNILSFHTKNKVIYEKNPSENHILEYKTKDFLIRFSLFDNIRKLICRGIDKELGNFNIEVTVPNNPLNDKMVILTPFFESKRMFYLNYKENYYDAKILFKSAKFKLNLDKCNGLLDSGRGYWPYKHEWYWGSGSISTKDNHKIGWNIGFGFGNLEYGNENYFFFDSKAYKIEIYFNIDNHPNGNLIIKSTDNNFYLELEPYYNNFTKTEVLWINKYCNQVFYKTKGYVIVNKNKYEFENEKSFLEHAVNRW